MSVVRLVLCGAGIASLLGALSVAQGPPAQKVVVAEARIGEAPQTITLVGTVEPVRRSRVTAEIAGAAAQVPIREGDFVEAGAVLAKLNDDALSLELAEAEAALGARKEVHAELLAGTRAEELTRLKALFEEAEANSKRWELEMARVRKLYAGSDANPKELYDTESEFIQAERRRIAARASYDLGVAGPRKEELARAAYEVAEQQAVADRLASDLRKTSIRAPFSGFVVERIVEVGEWVAVGGHVATLAELDSAHVVVHLPESAYPFVKVGDAARVKVDALARAFEGRIKHVIPQADLNARTMPVEIAVENRDHLLAAGMFARATLTTGGSDAVVLVPKDAIVQRNGTDYVATVVPGREGGSAGILLPVTVGAEVEGSVAVTSGNLPAGSRVIVRGNEQILPFPTPVEVVDERGTPLAAPSATSGATPHGGA